MSGEVYADYAASAPLRPGARRAMRRALDALARAGGNPSSSHRAGAALRRLLDEARAEIAAAIGAAPLEITLTSGATEANNLALCGSAGPAGTARLAVAATDHASVLAPAQALADAGGAVAILPVDGGGHLEPTAIATARPTLLSLSLVNAETGVAPDLAPIVGAARACGARVHLDAAQAGYTAALDVGVLDVDLVTLSGHKLGGPPGIGALYIRRGVELRSVLRGGAQEHGRRAGTENTPAALGFAAALSETVARRQTEAARVGALTTRLRAGIAARWPAARFAVAPDVPVAPHVVNVAFPGYTAEALVTALDLEGVAASAGSACAAGATEPSHVLLAMGWSADAAASALRFSLGWASTDADVAGILAALGVVLGRVDASQEAAWPARAS